MLISADAAECERITRQHARTFSLASRLLPTVKRRAAYALYAFCRIADDIVDRAVETHDGGGTSGARAQLERYRAALDDALHDRPSGPVFRELAWVTETFRVPSDPLFEVLAGVERDLATVEYGTWSELELYCQGVASSVGEMCTHVFGVAGHDGAHRRAVRYARTLGVAMQLTNILRDVGEDARRGRCYLPAEDLQRFGLTSADVLRAGRGEYAGLGADPRWRDLMRFQVARARHLYKDAMPGIALLHGDAQRCAAACATGYAGILGAIESREYDTFTGRARVSGLARVGILWGAWRYRSTPIAGPAIDFAPS